LPDIGPELPPQKKAKCCFLKVNTTLRLDNDLVNIRGKIDGLKNRILYSQYVM
jgi:hypothetical protein